MQIAEAQLLAKRAWHIQWARCVLTGLALIFVIFEEHRRFVRLSFLLKAADPFFTKDGKRAQIPGLNVFAILWIGFAIIAVYTVYTAEQTWHAWRQLQFARKLTHALTRLEFERAKAQEEWHNALRDMLLFAAVIVLISLTLRGDAHTPFTPILFFIALMPAARVGRSLRKLRRVSA